MYIPDAFAETRVEELHRIVRENPLGLWVTHGVGGLDANHLPWMLQVDAQGACVLTAHVARANPVWREVQAGEPTLVVFRGVQGYISPNWYPGKQETHQRVPTWAYEVVHAHGTVHVRDDEKFVRGVVARLTRQHEANQPQPWKMSDAPPAFIAEELSQVVGIEVRVTRLEGKRKLNQNHVPQDREGVVQGLAACGHHGLARAIGEASLQDPDTGSPPDIR